MYVLYIVVSSDADWLYLFGNGGRVDARNYFPLEQIDAF